LIYLVISRALDCMFDSDRSFPCSIFCSDFRMREGILGTKMVRGLGEAWRSIWRTTGCTRLRQMSLLPRSSRCSWIWRSPAKVTRSRHLNEDCRHCSSSSSSASPQHLMSSLKIPRLYRLFHHLCQWPLEAGWGVSHLLATLVLFLDYQLLRFITLWTSSRGLLLLLDYIYSMVHFLNRQYAPSAALHIVTLHSISSTTRELQR